MTLPLLTDNLQSVSSIKGVWLKWKKLNFLPVDAILLFKHSWILKNLQPLTLEWLDQQFSNFLSTTQIWVWWKRVKQRPKPQATYENIIIVWVILTVSLSVTNLLFSQVPQPHTYKHW